MYGLDKIYFVVMRPFCCYETLLPWCLIYGEMSRMLLKNPKKFFFFNESFGPIYSIKSYFVAFNIAVKLPEIALQ